MTAPIEAGIVGVGNMGSGIAHNLARSGFEAAAWDVSEPARKSLAGALRMAPPTEMAQAGAVIFFAVPSSAEISTGLDALLDQATDGTVIYDLTTSWPDDTRTLARRAAAHNVPYLDAAMSGGAAGAAAGTLTLMIGGEESVLNRTRPILDTFASTVFHLGPSGAGHTMKLIHNMVCHTIFLATCEGGRLCEKAGLSLEDMITVFNTSNARSYASEVRFPKHILSGAWDAQSRIHNLHKDLDMAMRLARGLASDTSCAQVTADFLASAVDLGMAEDDFSLLYRDYDRIRKQQAGK